MQVREKVGKSRFTVFLQWFVAPEGRKVTSLKRRVQSHLARREMNKCMPVWHEARLQVKNLKIRQVRTTFGSCDVEHAVVARSKFPSQNVKDTTCSDHFWKLRCWKSGRRCGAKHISKSIVSTADGLGPLLDVQMSFCVAGARDCAPCHKWAKREGFVAVSTTTTTIRHTTLHYTTLHNSPLHYTTLHYTTLHYTTLHYTTPHYTTLHYISYSTLNYNTFHFTTLYYTKLHATLNHTTLH